MEHYNIEIKEEDKNKDEYKNINKDKCKNKNKNKDEDEYKNKDEESCEKTIKLLFIHNNILMSLFLINFSDLYNSFVDKFDAILNKRYVLLDCNGLYNNS